MENKTKILVIRFSSLGDVVLTTALYPNLKAHWPDCEITLLTKEPYGPLFDGNPHVDHVRLFSPDKQAFSDLCKEIREQKFDIIIDLHNNMRSWFLRLVTAGVMVVSVDKAAWARRKLILFKRTSRVLERSVKDRILDTLDPLGVPIINTETILYPKDATVIRNTFSLEPTMQLIGIAPGAKHRTKQWSVANFADAANRLGAFPNTKIVILGDTTDKPVAAQIANLIRVPCANVAGWTNMGELIAILSQLKMLLTNDSGIMHMAEALKVPLVALFGPTVRAFGFAPYRSTSRVVEVTNLPCRPCTLHGDPECPLKHHRCMVDLDVNAVMLASSMILGEEIEKTIN